MTSKPHEAAKHPKQEFQVERLAFFSDAIFAIAITLLVIELKVPHITKESTYAEIWHEVLVLRYKFLSIVLSFSIIATYWRYHHFIFKHIHNYNTQMLKVSIMVLLPIIFFPFTTAFFYESLLNENILIIPLRLFLLNNIAASAGTFYLYWLVVKKHSHLTYFIEPTEDVDFKKNVTLTLVTFCVAFICSFISFKASLLGLLPYGLYRLYKKISIKKTL